VSDELRQEIEHALTSRLVIDQAVGYVDGPRLANAVMAAVQPLVDERDRLKDEAVHHIAQRLALDEVAKHADALRVERDRLLWLHAEAVWQLAIVRRYLGRPIKLIVHPADPKTVGHVVDGSGLHQGWVDSCEQCRNMAKALIDSWRLAGTGVDDRESRFRWAEEAAALQAKLDGPCGSCHPCVNWDATAEPGDAEEALTAALEAHQSAIVTMDDAGPEFDAEYAARIALDLIRSWRPTAVEAAPVEQTRDEMIAESMARIGVAIDAQEPACTCDATGAPEFPHRGYCELNHPYHECDPRSCRFAAVPPVAAGVSGTGTEARNAE